VVCLYLNKELVMSLPVNNNQKGKKGNNNNKKPNAGGSKFISKPGKAAGAQPKANRTGGSRGS
jgi:hypothetical protein